MFFPFAVILLSSAIAAMIRICLFLLFDFFFGRQFGFAEGANFLSYPSDSSKFLFAVGAFYRFSCSTRTKTHVKLPPVIFVAGGKLRPLTNKVARCGRGFPYSCRLGGKERIIACCLACAASDAACLAEPLGLWNTECCGRFFSDHLLDGYSALSFSPDKK